MSTRCKTVFIDRNGEALVTMYRHSDGYYNGHGKQLAGFLKGKKVVNGISSDDDESKIFNGIGCLAAQVIGHMKEGVGGIYIAPNSEEAEEYVYIVSGEIGKEPNIKVDEYDGPASGFDMFIQSSFEDDE